MKLITSESTNADHGRVELKLNRYAVKIRLYRQSGHHHQIGKPAFPAIALPSPNGDGITESERQSPRLFAVLFSHFVPPVPLALKFLVREI